MSCNIKAFEQIIHFDEKPNSKQSSLYEDYLNFVSANTYQNYLGIQSLRDQIKRDCFTKKSIGFLKL